MQEQPHATSSATSPLPSTTVEDYFSFRSMVSTKLMKVLYLIGFGLITLGGLWVFSESPLVGLLVLTAGNLTWRVLCEQMIVIHSIHEALVSIERHQRER